VVKACPQCYLPDQLVTVVIQNVTQAPSGEWVADGKITPENSAGVECLGCWWDGYFADLVTGTLVSVDEEQEMSDT